MINNIKEVLKMEKTLKFIFKVEKAQYWDEIKVEIKVEEYEDNLADYGLDYNSYDDPDIMWNDFLNAVIDYYNNKVKVIDELEEIINIECN